MIRIVAVNIIKLTSERLAVNPGTGDLEIVGVNPRGTWARTFVNSKDPEPILTADGYKVLASSRWEKGGVHYSEYPTTEYGGGVFESRRFIAEELYVCDTKFVREGRVIAKIRWSFEEKYGKKK